MTMMRPSCSRRPKSMHYIKEGFVNTKTVAWSEILWNRGTGWQLHFRSIDLLRRRLAKQMLGLALTRMLLPLRSSISTKAVDLRKIKPQWSCLAPIMRTKSSTRIYLGLTLDQSQPRIARSKLLLFLNGITFVSTRCRTKQQVQAVR